MTTDFQSTNIEYTVNAHEPKNAENKKNPEETEKILADT